MKSKQVNKTLSGKSAKELLKLIDGKRQHEKNEDAVIPSTEVEKELFEIWKNILGHEEFGIEDDFFFIGGNSIKAIHLISKISREFNIQIELTEIFLHPTILGMSLLVNDKQKLSETPEKIGVQFKREFIPLSFSQERLWFVNQLEGSRQFHNPSLLRLKGKPDKAALEKAMRQVVSRHESLRTVIKENNVQSYQKIIAPDKWNLNLIEGNKFRKDKDGLGKFVQDLIGEPFDLSKDYMLRASLIRLEEDEHILVVTMHHIASDAWSMYIIVKEVIEIYQSLVNAKTPKLETLELQYSDYAIWQRNYLQGKILDEKLEYWKKKLEGAAPLELPSDFIRPAVKTTQGETLQFKIEKELLEKLNILSQQNGSTLFMTLLTGFKILLYKYTGQNDLTVGTSMINRSHHELENLIGLFVNTLALRTEFSSDETFTGLLSKVRQTTLDAYQHQDVPFEKVVDAVVKERDSGISPLFQVMLVMNAVPEISQFSLGDVKLSEEEFDDNISKFDLTIFLTETGNNLRGYVQYRTDLFTKQTIERYICHFKEVLNTIVKDPGRSIREIQILTKDETKQLLEDFSQSTAVYPRDKTVKDIFEEQVKKTPDSRALVFEGKALTYRELNERSNQVAHYLRSKGIAEGSFVPVYMESGLELMTAIIGVLKSGAAYVPADSEIPAERLNFIIEDTNSKIILCSPNTKAKIERNNAEAVEINFDKKIIREQSKENINIKLEPENSAYVIYTSGSTGNPKGVIIGNRSLVDYVFGLNEKVDLKTLKTFALVSTIATDLGNTVIYGSLLTGGELHLFSKESVSNPEYMHKYFSDNGIECVKIVPSHWKALKSGENMLLPEKLLIFGGEVLHSEHAEKIISSNRNCKVVNHYGPTETTIGKLLHIIEPDRKYSYTIPIGRPFSNACVYVLSKDKQLCPAGVPGELYIGGEGTARGYLNNDELTKKKFIQSPFDKNKILYATGDLVKYLPDGNIEFIGRADDQVKVRGYRIEPGEIENALKETEFIKSAIVLAKEDKAGSKRLVAYIIPEGKLSREEVILRLKEKLPEYMIPAMFIEMEKFPLTAAGKIDRKVLPDADVSHQLTSEYSVPVSEAECVLSEIWKELLDIDKVGVHDNFFELGGDSIISIQLVSRARRAGYELQIGDVFTYQTIARLSALLEQRSGQTSESKGEQDVLEGECGLLPIQQWFFEKENEEISYFNQSVLLSLDKSVTEQDLKRVFEQLRSHHDALRFKYYRKENKWHQVYGAETEISEVISLDLRKSDKDTFEKSVKENTDKNQRSLDIEKGELMRVILIQTPEFEEMNKLLIIIHHLAVDGVTWRILLEDIERLTDEIKKGNSAGLWKKSSSYRQWHKALEEYGQSSRLNSQKKYWENVVKNFHELPEDKVFNVDIKRKDIEQITIKLNSGLTRNLMQEVSKAYHTEINDILTAALAKTLSDWSGEKKVLIEMEGHGRETSMIGNDEDVSRTAGWFTTHYPVLIEVENGVEEVLIKTVKEQMRKIPDKGIGFGVLKYINRDTNIINGRSPEIIFNYLGQTDNIFSNSKWFKLTDESAGFYSSGENKAGNKISVVAIIRNGELVINWNYSKRNYNEQTITDLSKKYITNLESLIKHCTEKKESEFTPSDFGLEEEITYDELDKFLNQDYNGKPRREVFEGIYRLSGLQQGMLFHGLYDEETGTYIRQLCCDMVNVNAGVFRKSWEIILSRHSALRSGFYHDTFNVPVQVVYTKIEVPLEETDCSKMNETEQREIVKKFELSECEKGFDNGKAPLMRIKLIKLSSKKFRMIWTWHHLLFDGWSMQVMMKEFLEVYEKIIAGKKIDFSEGEKFEDYIGYTDRINKDEEEAYWRGYMKGVEKNTLIPFIRTSTELTKGAGEYKSILIDADDELASKLKDYSQQQRLTINTIMQGTWSLLLNNYTMNDDITFGIIVSGRPEGLASVENKVGMFINTLPFHARTEEGKKVNQWLAELQTNQISTNQYQYTPLNEIQRLTGVKGDLFDSLLVVENYPFSNLREHHALQPENFHIKEQTNYPVTFSIYTADKVKIYLKYNSELLNDDFANEICGHFENVLKQIVYDEEINIRDIEIITSQEKRELLFEFNDTSSRYPDYKSIIELFEVQVKKTPDKTAVVFGDEVMTYGELNERSNRLANLLIEKGVKPGSNIGLLSRRSNEMIVSIFGILKSGCSYVPFNLEYPVERLRYIIEDTNITHIVTTDKELLKEREFESVDCIDVNDSLKTSASSPKIKTETDSCIYVMFTSGTTGRPKGIAVSQRNVIKLVYDKGEISVNENDKVLQWSNYSFDGSTYDIYSSLLKGASLYLIKDEWSSDADELTRIIREKNITVCFVTTALFNGLIEVSAESLKGMRKILFGGEMVSQAHVRKALSILGEGKITHVYGPTETTTYATSYAINKIGDDGIIPIGRPLSNTQLYVLDKNLKLVPTGVPGELCIGGDGVSMGYVNNDEMTQEKFILNPYSKNKQDKIYKTGDIVRWLPDGNIEYLGRIDEQVKIRGYRIELGEIESILLENEKVKQFVVLVQQTSEGTKRLVGYIVTEGKFDKEEIISYMSRRLPEYMIPQIWVEMESMPLNVNGKIDKRLLPEPDASELLDNEYIAPRNETEEKLAVVWKELLNVERVGVNDNFFELGGDSIIIIQIVTRARRAGIELRVAEIFKHQTIAKLALHVESKLKGSEQLSGEQGILTGECGLLPVQQWYLGKQEKDISHFNQSVLLEIDKSVDENTLKNAVTEILSFHDALHFKYHKSDSHWIQEYTNEFDIEKFYATINLSVSAKDYLNTEINDRSEKYQRSLNIEKGELAKFVLMKTPDNELKNRLLIIIHHLAIDGVSWRILLDDLEMLLDKITDNRDFHSGIKGSSYRQWYEALAEYSKSKKLISQIPYWEKIVQSGVSFHTDKKYEGIVKSEDTQIIEIDFDSIQTQLLVKEVPGVYHTEINDMLLCALAMTLCEYNKTEKIVIGLEGHGRENISENLNTTRTVGWFTNIYPVMLEVNAEDELSRTIKSVKEQMRQIPDKGIGYGVLKYLNKNEKLNESMEPDVMFNYLGQFDNVAARGKYFSAASESKGTDVSKEYIHRAKLMLYGYIQSGKFILNWRYSDLHFERETVTELSRKYKSNLESVITHCIEHGKKSGEVYTPSDYGLGDEVSVEELDKFLQSDDKDNIMSF